MDERFERFAQSLTRSTPGGISGFHAGVTQGYARVPLKWLCVLGVPWQAVPEDAATGSSGVRSIWGRLGGILGRSWGGFGGVLRRLWLHFGGSGGVLGGLASGDPSGGRLGAVLGRLGGVLEASWGVLGAPGGRLGASWRLPGASQGCPGGVLGCLGGVLEASWCHLERSGRLFRKHIKTKWKINVF